MKPMIAPAMLAALFASSALLAQDTLPDGQIAPAQATEGEIKLAKLLGNRVAGEPKSCIPVYGLRSMTIIDETALVLDFGRTIWVNVPQDPERLNDRDRLLTLRTSARMCREDFVQTENRTTGFFTGNILLNDFVPYRRPSSSGDAS